MGGRSRASAIGGRVRPGAAFLAVVLGLWTDARVLAGRPHGTLVSWLASLIALGLVVRGPRVPRPRPAGARRRAAVLALVCLPALVRASVLRIDRIHGDAMITAYFSATTDWRGRDFFAPVPADPRDWVAQFPAPFFALQKLFFTAFGESVLSVKLSTLPYVFVVSALLFAIAHELLDPPAAMLALVVYAFFGPSLYLDTLGVHFVSSTAAFLAFFYFAVRDFRAGDGRFAVWAGFGAGACYLFYLSSYLALPVAAAFFALRAAQGRGRRTGASLLLFSIAVASVLGPFLAESLHTSNYFLRRFGEVSLLDGELSPFRPELRGNASASSIVWHNLRRSFQALYRRGLGGQGGYEFGHRELLEPLAGLLLVLGVLQAIALARARREWVVLLLAVGGAFVGGVVLTMPPPAFHRLDIAFPFLALLIALPLHAVATAAPGSASFRRALVGILLGAVVVTQLLYFQSTTLPERDSDPLRLASFIDRRFPGRPLYVAAYPTFAFERIYRFVPHRAAARVTSDYHAELLRRLDPTERYVYVVTLPKDFDLAFEQRDPHGRIIRLSPEYSLFVN